MIGRQINFYLSPDDHLQLLTAINRHAPCVVVKRSELWPYHATTDFRRDANDWAIAYLCRPQDQEYIAMAARAGGPDDADAPLIQFIQSMQEGNTLRRGRFWFSPKHRAADDVVPQRKEFVDWAAAAYRCAKRELVDYGNGDWIGRDALARVERGGLQTIC